jgi:hypothetical protein
VYSRDPYTGVNERMGAERACYVNGCDGFASERQSPSATAHSSTPTLDSNTRQGKLDDAPCCREKTGCKLRNHTCRILGHQLRVKVGEPKKKTQECSQSTQFVGADEDHQMIDPPKTFPANSQPLIFVRGRQNLFPELSTRQKRAGRSVNLTKSLVHSPENATHRT